MKPARRSGAPLRKKSIAERARDQAESDAADDADLESLEAAAAVSSAKPRVSGWLWIVAALLIGGSSVIIVYAIYEIMAS